MGWDGCAVATAVNWMLKCDGTWYGIDILYFIFFTVS